MCASFLGKNEREGFGMKKFYLLIVVLFSILILAYPGFTEGTTTAITAEEIKKPENPNKNFISVSSLSLFKFGPSLIFSRNFENNDHFAWGTGFGYFGSFNSSAGNIPVMTIPAFVTFYPSTNRNRGFMSAGTNFVLPADKENKHNLSSVYPFVTGEVGYEIRVKGFLFQVAVGSAADFSYDITDAIHPYGRLAMGVAF